MSTREAWNRGNNLVATSVVALSGIAFLPEYFLEDHNSYKVDDGLLLVLGIIAIWWYKKANNRYTRSVFPVVMVIVSLAVKIMGFVSEMKDKDDVGDDIGGLILFIAAAILVIWLYKKAVKVKAS